MNGTSPRTGALPAEPIAAAFPAERSPCRPRVRPRPREDRLMTRLLCSNLWRAGLALSLALAASSAPAADVEWRAASDARPAAPAPAVTMGAPVALPPGA